MIRRLTVLCALFALVLGAGRPARADFPPIPTASEVDAWNPVEYLEYFEQVDSTLLEELMERARGLGGEGDPAVYKAYRADLKATVHEGRRRANLVPPFEGDAGMKDAVVVAYDQVLVLIDRDHEEMAELLFSERVRSEDLDRYEALQVRVESTMERTLVELRAGQAAFAGRHNVRLVETDETRAEDRRIRALAASHLGIPAFPPKGSRLPAEIHVSFALRYHNQCIDRHDAIMNHLNQVMDATHASDPAVLSSALTAALKGLRAERQLAEAEEPWRGDARLREANLAFVDGATALLEGPLREYLALATEPRLSAKEVDRINALSQEINTSMASLLGAQAERYGAFAKAWHFAEFQAWAAARDGEPAEARD